MIETVWNALNSPVAIAAIAAAVLWLFNRIYAARPDWRKWEPVIVAAVRWAEDVVPDDSANRAVQRFDRALQYVLKVYEQAHGQAASAKTVEELREGIEVVHSALSLPSGGLVPDAAAEASAAGGTDAEERN